MNKYPLEISPDTDTRRLASAVFEKAYALGYDPTVLIIKDMVKDKMALYAERNMESNHIGEVNVILKAFGVPAI